jgi:hypothetical protein
MEQRDMRFVRGCEPGLENTRCAIGRGIVPKRTGREIEHQKTVQVHHGSDARNRGVPLNVKKHNQVQY